MLSSELRRQLDILDYSDSESKVRVRCFAPKGMPLDEQLKRGMAWQKDEKTIIPIPIEGWLYPNKGRGVFVRLKKKRSGCEVVLDANGNPIWIEKTTYQDGVAYLKSLNERGYGIYLIPNEGGGVDTDITRFPALFYECDGIIKEQQWQKLRSLEAQLGRAVSMVIETRNSLHCYFKLDYDRLLPSTWTQYQQRLIQEQDSDPAIWNPARLMRLSGFNHQKWNAEQRSLEQFPVRLVQENDNTFALDDFDRILPDWDLPRWETKQPTERVATQPTDNPWDIRNFASYLDGYRENGRQGWHTCKCPAHNGESDNSLHIEQSTGAYKCHAGCDSKNIYNAALELAKSRGYQVPEKRIGHSFSELGGWLFKLRKQLTKTVESRKSWGVGFSGEIELEPIIKKAAPAIEYQSGERLDIWAEATKQDYKYILDTSSTGTGKSFDSGMVTSELFEARQVIYLSAEHRNPTTATLKSWADLMPRHEGLDRDNFGKLRRTKSGQPYIISPNCGRYSTISALRNKNVPGADTAKEICLSCKFIETCRVGAGNYDYLFDRAKTLSQSRLRAHPASLPDEREYDYSKVSLVWDEAGENLKKHRSIEVTEQDLNLTIARLALNLPGGFDALRPLLNTLHEYLCEQHKQPNKYGWKDAQLRKLLPQLADIDVDTIADALKPDLNFLNTTAEQGVDLADLPRQVRKGFSDSDATTAKKVTTEVVLNWLPDFLSVLLGNVIGVLKIQYGVLSITIPDERLAQITRAAKSNIFLDATLTAEDLALVLGVEPSEILTVRQAVPSTNNLEIIQIATMGRLGVGSDRSEFCQQRVDSLINQICQGTPGKVATLDFKRHTQDGDGKRRWWVDSRGVNDLEDCVALILVGTPCRSLSDLESEFTILYGRTPEEGKQLVKYPVQVKGQPSSDLQPYFEMEVSLDPEFREFCRRRILADIHQAIGRLRAHRRPGQQLKVYFVGDYPLDIPVTLKKASDITPDAASKTERVEMAIRGAVKQLKETGQKITQQAIARIANLSQGYISRFRELLLLLLNDSNSKSNNSEKPPPDVGESEWISREYLPLLAESPQKELLEGLFNIFEVYGQAVFRDIWDAAPAAAQVKILQSLMFFLNAAELRSLFAAIS